MATLGVGNGFPYCLEKIDVSNYDNIGWETYTWYFYDEYYDDYIFSVASSSNFSSLSSEEIEENKRGTYRVAVGQANGPQNDCSEPICGQAPVKMYYGDTDNESNFIGYGESICPSATVDCVSEEYNAFLTGWRPIGEQQTPPITYLKITATGSGEQYNPRDCDGVSYKMTERTWSGSTSCEIISDGSKSQTGEVEETTTFRECGENGVNITSVNTALVWGGVNPCLRFGYSTWNNFYTETSPTTAHSTYTTLEEGETRIDIQLSNQDNDDLALQREINKGATIGTSDSSIWQIRDGGYGYKKRTVQYKIECSYLIENATYRVTPRIQKRTALVFGENSEWEDVEVVPHEFTATSATHTIDGGTGGIDLDHIQGFEYEIVGVEIEAVDDV